MAKSKASSKKRNRRNNRNQAPNYCHFCRAGTGKLSYKDVSQIQKFITSRGKILSRERSGVCAKHQRSLAKAIKNARISALLPFTERHAL